VVEVDGDDQALDRPRVGVALLVTAHPRERPRDPPARVLVGPQGDCTTPSSIMNWMSVSVRMASPFP
jgi:hypothetical protein